MKFFFEDPEFDAQLQRTVVASNSASADLGEVLALALRITAGDYDDWFEKWSCLASTTAAKGASFALNGQSISAGKAYLRATEYWRQAIFFIRHDLGDARLQRGWRAHREAFRAAVPHLPWTTTLAEIPFAGAHMGAYLLRPDDSDTRRPTILAPCGFDSTAEAGYSGTAYMALPRGYNVLLWDGPGQGGMLYEQRVPMRPDFETVLEPVIDWLLTQRGIDAGGLILIGRSLAGYLAAGGQPMKKRLAALICDPGQVEYVSRIVPSMFSEKAWQQILAGDPELDAKLQKMLDDPAKREWFGARMSTMGAATVGDFLRLQPAYTTEKQAPDIQCPTLLTEGEGDFASQSEKLFDLLTCEKEYIRLTEKEGGGGHCCGLGQTLWEEKVFSPDISSFELAVLRRFDRRR